MIDLILCLACGLALGHVLTRVYDGYVSAQLDRELTEKLKARLAQLKERIVNSRIEEVNGSLFLYNRETDEFLGQGKDIDELEENVKSKYPNKLFNVPSDQLEPYMKD